MASPATPAALHLLSLHPSTSVSRFLNLTRSSASFERPFVPLYVAQTQHIIHRPHRVSREALLSNRFDLLIVLQTKSQVSVQRELQVFPYTDALRALVSAHIVLPISLPEHALSFLETKQRGSFVAPTYHLPAEWTEGNVRPPSSAIAQDDGLDTVNPTATRLTPSLADWLKDFGELRQGQGSIAILTLASLGPGDAEKIQAFQNEVSHRLGYPRGERSTSFNVVGNEAFESSQDRILGQDMTMAATEQWHSAELARWPDIWYWAEMVSSQDYQDTEEKHGISDGVLQDKCVICLTDA